VDGETLTLAGVGLAIGLAGAYTVTRLIQGQLFGVESTDLLTTLCFGSVWVARFLALGPRSWQKFPAGLCPSLRTRYRAQVALLRHGVENCISFDPRPAGFSAGWSYWARPQRR
jgi:hypothetical protein